MVNFETNFFQFIEHDLVALSIQSALWDIERAYQVLNNYLKTIHMDEQEKEKYRLLLLETKSELNQTIDRKSTRLNSSHVAISYAVFCLKKKKKTQNIHFKTTTE